MVRSRAEVALSLGVIALGIGVAGVTATLPSEGGYAGIGPNFIPAVVALGIIALGVWLAIEAFAGGWRDMPEHTDRFEPMPFVWVSAGLFAHMALIGWAGFIIASTVLFVLIARGFGSRRLVRDAIIAVVLSTVVFFIFTLALGLSLPKGPFNFG